MDARTATPSAPRKRLTQAERREAAEEALLDAAAELFAEQGTAETSVAAICERAGYSHGLINHHFGSKDVLVQRLAERCQRNFLATFETEPQSSGLELVLHIVDCYLRAFPPKSADARCFLVMWGAALVPGHAATFDEADERFRKGIARSVRLGIEDGSVAECVDADAFAAMLLAMVRGLGAQLLVDPERLNVPRVRAESKRVVRLALEASAEEYG